MTYQNIDAVIAANKAAGQRWFDPDTMTWWGTKIETGMIEGRYFVTSEDSWNEDGSRVYAARMARDDGRIDTVGEPYQPTLTDALLQLPHRTVIQEQEPPYEGTYRTFP